MKINCPLLATDQPATEDMIRALLPQLPSDEDSFLILEQTDQIYMQTLWMEDDNKYLVEFRDGNAETHYQLDQHLDLGDAIALLISYLQGDDQWRQRHTYSKLSF